MATNATSDLPCGFQGNPDVYGVGIRVGFYTQALAAWFANYFVASEARSLRPANLLYTLALFVSMITYASRPDEVYAIEIFLILTFLFCTGLIAASSKRPRYSARYLEQNIGYSATFHLLAFLSLVFSNWYWWAGLDLYRPTPCGTFVWVVVREDIYGWMRKLAQACNVIAIVQSAFLFLISFGGILKRRATRGVKPLFLKDVEQYRALYNREANEIADFKIFKRDMLKARSLWNKPPAAKAHSLHQAPAFESLYQAEQFLESIVASVQEEEVLSSETTLVQWNQLREKIDSRTVSVQQFYVWLLRKFESFRQIDLIVRVVRNRDKINAPSPSPDAPLEQRAHMPVLFDILCTVHGIVQHTAMLHVDPVLVYGVALTAIKPTVRSRNSNLWKWLNLASRVKRSQLPLKTQLEWSDSAVLQLLIAACLIIQVETTLVWNHVDEINTIGSFGQLLAFFVGVSGLLKVVYRKISDRIKGIDEESKKPDPDPFDEDIEIYLKWKKGSNRLTRSPSF